MKIEILNGDCVEIMKGLERESIDLVITSPPYNVGKEYESELSEDEYYQFLLSVFVQIKRLLKDDGRFCWNVPYQMYSKEMSHEISQWYFSVKAIYESGLKFRDNITWKQPPQSATAWGSFKSASSPWIRHETEAIIIGYKESWKKLNKGESTITAQDFSKHSKDYWEMPTERRNGHPAPYPFELVKRCLNLFSYKGDTILDPFIGSGTTAIVCRKLGRNCIGLETSSEYCELAENRLKQIEVFE